MGFGPNFHPNFIFQLFCAAGLEGELIRMVVELEASMLAKVSPSGPTSLPHPPALYFPFPPLQPD